MAAPIVYTDEEIRKIQYLYEVEKCGCRNIAERLGRGNNRAVKRILDSLNVTHRGLQEAISVHSGRALASSVNEVQVCEEYRQGVSPRIIQKTHNISDSALVRILKKNQVPRLKGQKGGAPCMPIPEETVQDICSRYQAPNYESINSIAGACGRSRPYIIRLLKRNGVTIREGVKTRLYSALSSEQQDKWENLESYRETGVKLTVDSYAQLCGVQPSAIYSRIRHRGLRDIVAYRGSTENADWARLIKETLGIEPQWVCNGGEYHGFTNTRCSVDLWFPEKKVGIDINPTMWHSTQHIIRNKPKNVTYHQERALDAERNGWLLYQIYDWDDKRLVLQSLKHSLGLDTERYYARKCSIVYPDENIVRQFLREHHRQQDRAIGSVYVGLEYQGDLVGVMTFGKERFKRINRGVSPDEYELIRFATKGIVAGGASRMFQHFVKTHNPRRIKTFSSLDSGQGKVYETLGFKFERLAGLNGWYAHLCTKEAYKVTTCTLKFQAKYKELGMSQQEYMNSLGYYRINDAGNKVFIWQSK